MRPLLIIFTALTLPYLPLQGQSICDTVSFQSDGSKLIGYFYSSSGPGSPTLLFTQGFMETGDIWNIGKTLSENGINVFMFDFRGCFGSEGKQSLMHSQEDIESALSFLRTESTIRKFDIDTSNIIIGGYSYGGHMSMLYAIYHPDIKRVISISGGDLGILGDLMKSNPDLRKGYSEYFQSIKKPKGPVDFQYTDPTRDLIDNQEYFYILKKTKYLTNTDVFMTGGLDDNTVSLEQMVLPLYRNLKKNKGQKVTCKIYQTGHSYNAVSENLLHDTVSWIKEE